MMTVVKFVSEVPSKLRYGPWKTHFLIKYFKLLSLQEAKPDHF